MYHRWNNTYILLQSIKDYEEALIYWVHLYSLEPSIKLDRFDFLVARLVMDFLQVFYKVTNTLFGSYYCTSHLFFHRIFQISAQVTKYKDMDLLDIFIVNIEPKIFIILENTSFAPFDGIHNRP